MHLYFPFEWLYCPPYSPRSFDRLVLDKQEAQSLYEETSMLLQSYIDDGNTQLMTQQIEMAGEGDAYQAYQYLMQTSPYLSEQVLTALGEKEDGFNKAMIRDVMVENPQAAKSEDVNFALDNRTNPLPAYMRWQINSGLSHFGQKEVMEQFIAYQKNRYDMALNEIIRGIVYYKEGFENAPSIDELLAPVNDIRYQYLRAEFQIAQGEYDAGMDLLNAISRQYPLNSDEAMQAHQDKVSFYTLLAQWDNDEHPGFTNLPENALQQLEIFLEATPRVSGKALSLLMLNQPIDYTEPILYPTHAMELKSDELQAAQEEELLPEIEHELRFSLYPNPSRDYLTLNWCIESPRKAEKGKIEIRNASGIVVQTLRTQIPCNKQIVPLDGWQSGSYTATLYLGTNMHKTIHFMVAK